MNKVKSVRQLAPNTKRLKSIYPTITNSTERVFRPAQKVSTLIKRGLVDGIKSNAELGDAVYDDSEGRCPDGLRVDVDKFDLATKMMRNGDSTKSIYHSLLGIESTSE